MSVTNAMPQMFADAALYMADKDAADAELFATAWREAATFERVWWGGPPWKESSAPEAWARLRSLTPDACASEIPPLPT